MMGIKVATAIACARRDWPVFPCAGKQPIPKHGLLEATTDEVAIRNWWHRWPDANLAIIMGPKSGLFVLDIDGDDGEATLAALEREHGALPQTVEVLTGKGRHLYFQFVEGLRNTAKRLGPGLDTRGDGGYVIAPPSIHPDTGRAYEWSVDGHPADAPVAALPDWLLKKLTEVPNGTVTPPEEWRALVGSTIAEGQRNHTVARVAGHLLRRYVDPYVALELVSAWNERRCQPPLEQDEIEQTVNSIARRELARRNAT